MAKKQKQSDERAAIADQIRATPTASDAQVAAAVTEALEFETKVSRDTVSDVRHELGAKDTWHKEGSK